LPFLLISFSSAGVLRAYGVTEKGRVRANNQDYFAVDEALQLCVVADGMGGHKAGEIASRLAVETLVEFLRDAKHSQPSDRWPFGYDSSLSATGNRVRTAIHFANAQILEASNSVDEYSGMGTTVVVAMVHDSVLSVGHVGDSRLYVLAHGRLRPLTRDDSWMAAVFEQDPALDPAVARLHPMRNVLTNVVGTRPETEVHVTEEPLNGSEILLLSTDGVHGVLDDGWLEKLMTRTDDLRDMARGLVRAALTGGSRDNCTAVVARYTPDKGQT
jgi:protein phosphatase